MNYRDKFYSKYVSTHIDRLYGDLTLDGIEKQFRAWQVYFGGFLPEDKNVKIIDIGCGNGGFVYWLSELGYKNVEGIDMSGEQIEIAGKLGIKNVQQADIKKFLKNKREFYDIIFARDVIEHFNKEEILDILNIVYKSLKQNGKFVCQTVNAENLLWGRLRHGDFTHGTAFTKESASQVLLVIGFRDVKIYPQQPIIHGLKSFIRYFLWKCIEYCLRLYLFIETGLGKGIFTQNLIVRAEK